jgi:hypothetical protein
MVMLFKPVDEQPHSTAQVSAIKAPAEATAVH